jgi:hypothetical protein
MQRKLLKLQLLQQMQQQLLHLQQRMLQTWLQRLLMLLR